MVSISKTEIYSQVKPNTCYEEQFFLLILFTCNPRLGKLREYDCFAQGQLPQASEKRKMPYVLLVIIIRGYQGKNQSLPRLVEGRSVLLFHSELLQLLLSRTLAKGGYKRILSLAQSEPPD